jgi:hypothetical protein
MLLNVDPTKSYTNHKPSVIMESAGLVPEWIFAYDVLPPGEDKPSLTRWLDECYAHGGGWQPFGPWTLDDDGTLTYAAEGDNDEDPDPPYKPLYAARIEGGYTVYQYPHAWVCVRFPTGDFEVSRMD